MGLLMPNGVQKKFTVHRLVAEVFMDDFDCEMHVDHKNRVRSDNRLENLRITTPSQNHANKIKSVGVVEHIIELYTSGLTAEQIYETFIYRSK